ncbi:MAG: hypothetical protein IKS34_01245 [Clostridia bacterium]|nr:hypothetical protein [Clostridia bacterium]
MDEPRTVEAGRNRSLKLIRRGEVCRVWIASDADGAFSEELTAAAIRAGLVPDRSKTGRQLADMCGVEVFTAAAVERKSITGS